MIVSRPLAVIANGIGRLRRTLRTLSPGQAPRDATSAPPAPAPAATLPPQYAWAEDLHRHQMASLATAGDLDILLVGDSLAQHWPVGLWAPWRVMGLGVGGDRTQHVAWRLDQIAPGTSRPARILVVAGTNDLLAGDGAAAIAPGIGAIVRRLGAIYPDASVFVLLPPPLGIDLGAAAGPRRDLGRLLAAMPGCRLVDADADLIGDGRAPNPNYAPDLVHLTHAGYEILTRRVRAAAA